MVYLYKCPSCVFGEMDLAKGCGSGDFISAAFLHVSPSIRRLTEAMSLKVSYRRLHTEVSQREVGNGMRRLLIHCGPLVKYSPYITWRLETVNA